VHFQTKIFSIPV